MNNAHLSASVKELFEEHKSPMMVIEPSGNRILFANRSSEVIFSHIRESGLDAFVSDPKKLQRHLKKSVTKGYHRFKMEMTLPVMPLSRIDVSLLHLDNRSLLLLIFSNISRLSSSKKIRKHNREVYRELNTLLAKRIENEVSLRFSQDELFLQQSKMAALGEMMDAIAHQWKQPLNSLYFYAGMLREPVGSDTLPPEEIEEISLNMEKQIEHLNNTLNEFRSFYRQDKTKRHFFIQAALKSVLSLMHDQLMHYRIETGLDLSCDFSLDGYENEFKHILINLINNAKDAFEVNRTQKRMLAFRIGQSATHYYLSVEDNAGGIPEAILNDIFQQGFTTKTKEGGSGVGLHLASLIASKHRMDLHADNAEKGARFTLLIDKNDVENPQQ